MDLAQQQEHIVQLQEGSFLIDTNLNKSDLNKILMKRIQNLLEAKPLTKALIISGSDFAAQRLKILMSRSNFFRRIDNRDRYEVHGLTFFCWNMIRVHCEDAGVHSDVALCATEQDRLTILRDAIILDDELATYFAQSPNQETLLKDWAQAIAHCKNNGLDPATYRDTKLFPQIYYKYQKQLEEHHAVDKEDAIIFGIKTLENNSATYHAQLLVLMTVTASSWLKTLLPTSIQLSTTSLKVKSTRYSKLKITIIHNQVPLTR